jgi:hypothetical protein
MHSVAFVRRMNPAGNPTSSCPTPLNEVIRSAAELALEAAENLRLRNLSERSGSLSLKTFTERVLMFLEKYNA